MISLAVLLLAAPASDLDVRQTRKLIHDYGKCVVDKEARKASEAILGNASNDAIIRRYPMLIDGRCVRVQGKRNVQVRFNGDHYAYALADALVRRDYAAAPAAAFTAVPALVHSAAPPAPATVDSRGRPLKPAQLAAADEAHRRAQGFEFLSRFGECVVRAEPVASRALLVTGPDTPAEATAFAALKPAFGQCIGEGASVELTKLVLRGTVAINYYRLAKAAR